jgi:hypothetical protein
MNVPKGSACRIRFFLLFTGDRERRRKLVQVRRSRLTARDNIGHFRYFSETRMNKGFRAKSEFPLLATGR